MSKRVSLLPCEGGVSEIAPLVAPVFVSDMHLSWTDTLTVRSFFDFLSHEALHYRELFLLGDIFAFWLGDDAMWLARPVVSALKAYTATGRKLYLMQGNRDVMLGEDFARATSATLVKSGIAVECRGSRILLAHGDEWCTLDAGYQEFRTMMHSRTFQAQAFDKSVLSRILWASRARKTSAREKTIKTAAMMDVVDSVVTEAARQAQCSYVIHGHTHKPRVHEMQGLTRFVLSDWALKANPARRGWIDLDDNARPRHIGSVLES